MTYIRQNFTSGQTLKADHLNHMEEGIANAGGVTSWNDLEDKPFGEKVLFDITWDGVIGDRDWADASIIQEGVKAIKVSDKILTADELVGAEFIYDDATVEIVSHNVSGLHDTYGFLMANDGMITTISDTSLTLSTTGIDVPSTGTYFVLFEDSSTFVSQLKKIEVIKLDKTYIPDSVITEDNIDSYIPTIPSDIATQSYVQNYVSSSINTAITNAIGGSY